MDEFIMFGTGRDGLVYPVVRGMCFCIQQEIDAYKKKYPPVVRVCVEVAINETRLGRVFKEQSDGS